MEKDRRASWCGINHLHGPHGAKSKEPCPGWGGNPSNSNGVQRMASVTKATVESAVASLNDKAEQLGLDRRFEFMPGSRNNGISHRLTEFQTSLEHPVSDTKIGRSLAEALGYVTAMNHGLLAVLGDRAHARLQATSQHAVPTYANFTPDGPQHDSGATSASRIPAEDADVIQVDWSHR